MMMMMMMMMMVMEMIVVLVYDDDDDEDVDDNDANLFVKNQIFIHFDCYACNQLGLETDVFVYFRP